MMRALLLNLLIIFTGCQYSNENNLSILLDKYSTATSVVDTSHNEILGCIEITIKDSLFNDTTRDNLPIFYRKIITITLDSTLSPKEIDFATQDTFYNIMGNNYGIISKLDSMLNISSSPDGGTEYHPAW